MDGVWMLPVTAQVMMTLFVVAMGRPFKQRALRAGGAGMSRPA